jgi:hypothetical protein
MSQDYQDLGLDSFGTRAIPISDKPKTIVSPLEADSMFGDGSFPGMKLASGPDIATFGFPDNFNASYPFILPYYIDSSSMVVRATLSLFFQPFRAYSTAAASGGGSTSGSGGGQTSSSATATVTTTDTQGQTSHQHGAVSKRRTTDWQGEDSEVRIRSLGVYDLDGREKCQLVLANKPDTNDWNLSVGYTETGHSHNVSTPSHTHTVADHTHTTPAHTHGITYGIYSSGYPTAVSITIDGVDVTSALGGPWNPSVGDPNELDMDITNYTASTGSHEIQLTTTGQGRCIPLLVIKSVIGSKS